MKPIGCGRELTLLVPVLLIGVLLLAEPLKAQTTTATPSQTVMSRTIWSISPVVLLSSTARAAPVHSNPEKGRCTQADVVAAGEVVELQLWKRSDLVFKEAGAISLTNSCGGYVAEILVTKVLGGESSERVLRVRDELGEWCDTAMALGDRYVVWANRDESAFRRIDSARLLRSKLGRLAISPIEAESRGVAALILSMEFDAEDSEVQEAGDYSKAERQNVFLKPGFAVEVNGSVFWKKGAYLDDVAKALGNRPCVDEQRPQR